MKQNKIQIYQKPSQDKQFGKAFCIQNYLYNATLFLINSLAFRKKNTLLFEEVTPCGKEITEVCWFPGRGQQLWGSDMRFKGNHPGC